jgi:hypothetical protein
MLRTTRPALYCANLELEPGGFSRSARSLTCVGHLGREAALRTAAPKRFADHGQYLGRSARRGGVNSWMQIAGTGVIAIGEPQLKETVHNDRYAKGRSAIADMIRRVPRAS